MKRFLFALIILLSAGLCRAQLPTGTWSGALDIQGVSLTLVFHFAEDGCTLDVPDQGAKGLKATASLTALGAVQVQVPSIGASYEGFRFGDRINGKFSQNGMSLPLTLTPGALNASVPRRRSLLSHTPRKRYLLRMGMRC